MSVALAPRARMAVNASWRGVEEGDHAALGFDVVSADVLRDAAGFARGDLGAADVVQQRGLAVVDVAHDGHDRRARQLLGFRHGGRFVQEGFRIVQLGGDGDVAQFLDHDHGRFLVQHLVDGDHLAQLHQVLDDFRGLDGHLVRQVGHADGLGHVDFTRDEFLRRRLVAAIVLLVATATAAGLAAALAAGAPAVAAGRRRRLVGRLLAGGVVGPGRGDFGRLDGLLRTGSARLGVLLGGASGRGGGLAGRLVQRARQRRGRRFRLGSAQHLRGRFSISRSAAASASAARRASSRAALDATGGMARRVSAGRAALGAAAGSAFAGALAGSDLAAGCWACAAGAAACEEEDSDLVASTTGSGLASSALGSAGSVLTSGLASWATGSAGAGAGVDSDSGCAWTSGACS